MVSCLHYNIELNSFSSALHRFFKSDSLVYANRRSCYSSITGLNVYSMLKHQTLVLTLAALERIEERMLFHLHRNDAHQANAKFKLNQL
jgi:large subunit ribosomal protein L4